MVAVMVTAGPAPVPASGKSMGRPAVPAFDGSIKRAQAWRSVSPWLAAHLSPNPGPKEPLGSPHRHAASELLLTWVVLD